MCAHHCHSVFMITVANIECHHIRTYVKMIMLWCVCGPGYIVGL